MKGQVHSCPLWHFMPPSFNPDTYRVVEAFPVIGGYDKYGDNEVRCRECEMILSIPIFPKRDWANPGCQYGKEPYGPCP